MVEQSWWKLLDFAQLKCSSVSFFEVEKPETAVSRWSRARTRAAKVGKGLSKNEKATKLALQHWLEAVSLSCRLNLSIDSLIMMISRTRSDIDINLPALIKLDALLIEILDSFQETEFWYDEQGSMSTNSRTGSFRKVAQPQRNEEKWWLPLPCVSAEGLSETAKKQLSQKRDATNQIHKAAMAINSGILSDMEILRTYTASLPKSGRSGVGDTIYRNMMSNGKR